MENTYVNFVKDMVFEECMKETMETYKNSKDSLKSLNERKPAAILHHTKNTTDSFKALFDIYGLQLDLDNWKQYEISRAISYGNRSLPVMFHLNLLTKVDGWDWYNSTNNSKQRRIIKNDENTKFIDIRNFYNSSDIGTQKHIWRNFEEILKKYPDAVCYRGYIISKNHEKNINQKFTLTDKDENDNIREISGDVIYHMVTDEESALSNTFKAIRLYLKENSQYKLTTKDEDILDSHQNGLFN